MEKKVVLFLFLMFGSISYCVARISSNSSERHPDKQVQLEEILIKCAEYCERLNNSALFFVCQEKIEEEIYSEKRRRTAFPDHSYILETNDYIYDYQLTKKGGDIQENRILLEENGKKKNEKNAILKTKTLRFEKAVFGPVGLLSKSRQKKYGYKITKNEKVNGKEAILVEAVPIETVEEGSMYGKVWVDENDFSILKIQAEPESIGHIELIKKKALRLFAILNISVSYYYDIEKNGLRFPSKIVFEENYVEKKVRGHRELKISRTIITYSNYKFFIVEVDVNL